MTEPAVLEAVATTEALFLAADLHAPRVLVILECLELEVIKHLNSGNRLTSYAGALF